MVSKEVFLSYDHEDKAVAGRIKEELATLGFSAFLAHEDIEVSAEWRSEILKHLDNCSTLVAVVTENFAKSVWTNQEVGFVLGKGKPIISLVFGETAEMLPGFLESLQAISTSNGSIKDAANQIGKIVSETRESGEVVAVYQRIVVELNKFVKRWESNQRLPERERWIPQERDDMLRVSRSCANQLFNILAENESSIDLGVRMTADTVVGLMKKFSYSQISVAGRSNWEEMEKQGASAYDAARALLTYLRSTKTS
jgi:hypothetical protein